MQKFNVLMLLVFLSYGLLGFSLFLTGDRSFWSDWFLFMVFLPFAIIVTLVITFFSLKEEPKQGGKVYHRALKGKVGIIILVDNPFWFFLMIILFHTRSGILEPEPLCTNLFSILIIVGLVLYLVDRKKFWGSFSPPSLLVTFGLLLFGLFLSFYGFSGISSAPYWIEDYLIRNPSGSVNQWLIEAIPGLLFTTLWFISGVVLLVDSLKQLIRLKQELEW